MEAFEYASLDQQGKTTEGVIQADNEKQARQLLRDQNLIPIRVEKVLSKGGGSTVAKTRLRRHELPLLIRQLSTLIKAGLPLDDALSTLVQQAEDKQTRKIISVVHARVMEGLSLAAALRYFPNAFEELITTSIEAGEQSGRLSEVLDQLADYLELREQMGKQSLTALIYPFILILTAIAVVTGLMVYIVPKVIQVFESTQVELPLATRILIGFSDWVIKYGLLVLILLAVALGAFIFSLRIEHVRQNWHRRLLKMPLLGRLIRTAQSARFTRTLGILSKSSVPIVPALSLSAKVVDNLHIRKAVEQAASQVREGSSLSMALRKSGQFPPMTVKLINSGEQSGHLSDMLMRAAQAQETDVNHRLNTLVSALQPIAILFVGLLVLFIVLALLLPIFQINTILN